jgi:hypothetical protein
LSAGTLTGFTEDTFQDITHAQLVTAVSASDVDSDAISFRVDAITTGTLEKRNSADTAWVAVVADTTTIAVGEKLQWKGAQDANGSALNAFTVSAFDGTAYSAAAVQVSAAVAASNDAPTGLGTLSLAAVDEDTAAPAGLAISSLTGLSFSDVDGANTMGGVAVVGNTASASTEGAWQYSTNAGSNWYAIGSVNDSTGALALSASTLVRFVPVGNYNGSPAALTVRALDNTYTAGYSTTAATETRVSVTTTSNGGTSAISANTNTISTSITAVNDAPTAQDATITINENSSKVFTSADFGFADTLDNPANTLNAVIISTLPTAGTLKLGTAVVTPNQSIPISDINSGSLVYTPTPGDTGAAYAQIGFKVQDSGGLNSGVDTSLAKTLTINVPLASKAQFDLVKTVLGNTNGSGYTYSYDTGSFYKYETTTASWESANTAAFSTMLFGVNGHLVHINSFAEDTYVNGANAFNGASGYSATTEGWMGGSDKGIEGAWKWYYGSTAGETFSNGATAANGAYINWAAGVGGGPAEPNGVTSENYLRMNHTALPVGKWLDVYATNASTAHRYLVEVEGSAILNRLSYLNTDSIKLNTTEAGTAYLVKSTNAVTTVAGITALPDAEYNSVALAGNTVNELLSKETFSSNAGIVGWTSTATAGSVSAVTTLAAPLGSFLGSFSDAAGTQKVSKTYAYGAAKANTAVTIEFDMYELDAWNGELFKVFVNNTMTSARSYHAAGGIADGGVDVGNLSTANATVSNTEEVHHYVLKGTTDASGNLTLGFGSTTPGALATSSWGIDNVVITTAAGTNTTLSLAGLNAGTYKLYSADAAGNLSAAANGEVKVVTVVAPPVTLDLNGDGHIHYTQATLDINLDGQLDRSGWVGAEDGLLFHNKFGDGSLRETGQYQFAQSKDQTDLQGLAQVFDTNQDGWLNAQDARFEEFAAWSDKNQDGKVDAGELVSLQDLGIESIHLVHEAQGTNGTAQVTVHGDTSANLSNGTKMLVQDTSFLYQHAVI